MTIGLTINLAIEAAGQTLDLGFGGSGGDGAEGLLKGLLNGKGSEQESGYKEFEIEGLRMGSQKGSWENEDWCVQLQW